MISPAVLIENVLFAAVFLAAFSVIAWRKRQKKFLFYGGIVFVVIYALIYALLFLLYWKTFKGR